MRSSYIIFLVLTLFYLWLFAPFLNAVDGDSDHSSESKGEFCVEGSINSSEGFKYRGGFQNEILHCSTSIKGNWNRIEGSNLVFNSGPLYLGSITILGLVREILIPSLTRSTMEIKGTGLRSDRSYTGSSRRGIGLSLFQGDCGGFFLKDGEDRYEGGVWLKHSFGLFSPGFAAVISNPGSDTDEDGWIYEKSPFLSEYTTSVLLYFPYISPSLSVFLLSGLSFGRLDPFGWWCRGAAHFTNSYFNLSLQGGASAASFRKPAGESLKEAFSWNTELLIFPDSLFSVCFNCGETQEQEGLMPETCRPFSSFVSATLNVNPKYWDFNLKGELSHRGEGSGYISRKGSIYGKISCERGSFNFNSDLSVSRYEGIEGIEDALANNVNCRITVGIVNLSLFSKFTLENQATAFTAGGKVEVREGGSSVYLKLNSSWQTEESVSDYESGEIVKNFKNGGILNIFDDSRGFVIEIGFKMMRI